MEYESRRIKWYWLTLFLTYCGGVIYLLFQGNPLLYSHHELRSAMDNEESQQPITIPANPIVAEKLTSPTGHPRFTSGNTAADPLSKPRDRQYSEFENYPIKLGIEDYTIQNITPDESGFYLSGINPWVAAVDMQGEIRWKYKFKVSTNGKTVLPVLIDGSLAYLIHPNGTIVCLRKLTGEFLWTIDLNQEVVAKPILWETSLLVPTKSSIKGAQLRILNRANGKLEKNSPQLDVKQAGFDLTYSELLKSLIITVSNKVMALSVEDWSVDWTQTLTDPIVGPAVLAGPSLFVGTLGAKMVRLDGAKNGKIEWEAELALPPAAPPTYSSLLNRLAVMDKKGGLSAIDAKTGKVFWHISTGNSNPTAEVWSARLSGKFIEDYKMEWLHKGWSFWAPCSDNRFCAYTPNKGDLIMRELLSGTPIGLPYPMPERWVFLIKQKAGGYAISHMVENSEVKKLRAAKSEQI